MIKNLLVIFIAGVLALTACQPVLAPENAPAAIPVSGSGVREAEENATNEIISALLKLYEQGSFRVEQTVSAPGRETQQQIEIIPPDRFHLSGPDMEIVVIASRAYMKVDDVWTALPGSGDSFVYAYFSVRNTAEAAAFRRYVSGAADLGKQDLNGEPARLYEYTIVDPDVQASASVRLWVGLEDGLPWQQVTTIHGSAGSSADAEIRNVYQDFNASFDIEPPDP